MCTSSKDDGEKREGEQVEVEGVHLDKRELQERCKVRTAVD